MKLAVSSFKFRVSSLKRDGGKWWGKVRGGVGALVLLPTVGLGGCVTLGMGGGGSASGGGGDGALPRLGEIRSQVTPIEPPEVDAPVPEQRVSATIQQVELPLHTNLDESWALTNEGVLSERARSVWNANGVRMGLMSVAEVEAFFDPLPYVLNVRRARLISGAHPSALRTSATVHEPVRMDLAVVAEGDEAVVELDRGRMRLLIDTQVNSVGGVTVTLTPHQQVRRLSLTPRDPLEKDMDGRLFEELAVSFDMNRNDVLVLGLYWPWPDASEQEPAEPVESEESEADEARGASASEVLSGQMEQGGAGEGAGGVTESGEDDGDQPRSMVVMREGADGLEPWSSEEASGPELASHFGRAVFASRRPSGALQHVLLLHVAPTGVGE